MGEAGSTDSDSKRPETDDLRAVKAELEGLRVQAERELLHSETALIEQEHRWIRIAVNIWNAIHVWRGPDPRRRAALVALAFRIISPATAGGILLLLASVGTLLLTFHTNLLLRQQNDKLDQQTHLSEAQRTALLVGEFTSVLGKITDEATNACLKTPIVIDRETHLRCWRDIRHDHRPLWLRHWIKEDSFRVIWWDDRFNESLERIDSPFKPGLPLKRSTETQLAALTGALRPYRFLETDERPRVAIPVSESRATAGQSHISVFVRNVGAWVGLAPSDDAPRLTRTALSPERGQLLATLARYAIHLQEPESLGFRRSALVGRNLAHADLSHLDLSGSDFECADLKYASFVRTRLTGSSLRRADMREADLSDAMVLGVDLSDALLSNACLPGAAMFRPVSLRGADLSGALVPDADWVAALRDPEGKLVAGLEGGAWRLEAAEAPALAGGRECRRLSRGAFRVALAKPNAAQPAPAVRAESCRY